MNAFAFYAAFYGLLLGCPWRRSPVAFSMRSARDSIAVNWATMFGALVVANVVLPPSWILQ